jgi:hypothetical protein
VCLYFDATDGYLRFISTIGQATVLFLFRVVIFSGGSKNIAGQMTVPFFFGLLFFGVLIGVCILTRAPIMLLTYDRKKILPEKKVQLFKARKKYTLTESLDLIVSVK